METVLAYLKSKRTPTTPTQIPLNTKDHTDTMNSMMHMVLLMLACFAATATAQSKTLTPGASRTHCSTWKDETTCKLNDGYNSTVSCVWDKDDRKCENAFADLAAGIATLLIIMIVVSILICCIFWGCIIFCCCMGGAAVAKASQGNNNTTHLNQYDPVQMSNK